MWARSDGRFEKSVLQVYNRIGQFIQPTSVNFSRATRSSFRENAKKQKIPYAFTTNVPSATVLVTPAGNHSSTFSLN